MGYVYYFRSLTTNKSYISGIPSSFGILLAVLLMLPCSKCLAQGDLLISPLRIIFEGSKKTQEINLANVGKDTAVYAISVKNFRMMDNGGFTEITEPDSGQHFAEPFLRFFPRKVTLAPNEAQVVKIQLIKTNELPIGECRSHLYFRGVPDEKPQGEAPSKKDSGISIHLVPIYGITIPVIIRSGECQADVALSDVSFELVHNDTPTVRLTFNRTGNISIYGDMKVDYISPSGKSKQVKIVKGIGIYTPNLVRHTSIELDRDKDVDYHKGKLHITYAVQQGDKTTKNVETDIVLN
jgi:hypothetical protein